MMSYFKLVMNTIFYEIFAIFQKLNSCIPLFIRLWNHTYLKLEKSTGN